MTLATLSRVLFTARSGSALPPRWAASFSTKRSVFSPDAPSNVAEERSKEVIKTRQRRLAVIHDPFLNRGTGFSSSERERLCLRGLVPPREQQLEQQIKRVMATYYRQRSNLDKFQYLSLLMDRNTVLFYRVLNDHLEELGPIIYTPTVGEACEKFHLVFRRSRGMYFSLTDRHHFRTMVYNWPRSQVDVIVVTDGSRVLALGDLGCNSMNIPIGKLALYVSAAGINPARVLPVVLDVGTDNDALRENPLYLGLQRRRLKGDEYLAVLDEWMSAVRKRWPHALVQFEDFGSDVASTLLERYRYAAAPAFNDDIQSTGCIAVATLLASLRARDKEVRDIADEVIVCAGAGSAGLGVCNAIVDAVVNCGGVSRERALQNFYVLDQDGMLGPGAENRVHRNGLPFVRHDMPDGLDLRAVVQSVKPTVLLGLSGQGGLFTKDILKDMAKLQKQPVILPMSNPSSASECTATDAFQITNGRAIFASGSPFNNVTLADGRLCYSNQANNVYSFPGLGLAVTALGISCVTDDMFLAAAKRIAMMLPDKDVRMGLLFPRIKDLRSVSAEVATAVGLVAVDQGLVTKPVDESILADHNAMLNFMKQNMWQPKYGHLVAEESR